MSKCGGAAYPNEILLDADVKHILYNKTMIKIVGNNELWRGGKKIGWIEGHYIKASDGRKLGYFEENFVKNEEGHKLAYVEGDYLISYGSNGESKVPLEKVSEEVEGGIGPGIDKCAVYVLLGD
jgi:hypothetical protein